MATVVSPIAVSLVSCSLSCFIYFLQVPQIWNDYMGDPKAAVEQQKASIKSRIRKRAKDDQAKKKRAAAKKAAAAAAKAAKATARQTNKRARMNGGA